MHHLVFGPSDTTPVVVLIKTHSLVKHAVERTYVAPLIDMGVQADEVMAFSLRYDQNGKANASFIKEYLEELLPALVDVGAQYLYVADSAYFKVLAKVTKTEPHHGYIMPCAIKGYEHLKVVLGINYQALVYNPDLSKKIDLGLGAIVSDYRGAYKELGTGIIHSRSFPVTVSEIQEALLSLHQYPELACDIETFSLRFDKAGIGTIAFARDKNNGLAFACDYREIEESDTRHGSKGFNTSVRTMLKEFFETYQGTLIWHSANYDVKVLVYELWMEHPLDTVGMLKGIEVLGNNVHDTKLIAYLATNSTADVSLGLKQLAHEFAGNYAVEDIKDITQVPLAELLEYNLVDTLCTWFVKEKYYPMMVADNQETIYYDLMLPTMKLLLQTELTGMPMCDDTILTTRKELEALVAEYQSVLVDNPVIKVLDLLLQNNAMVAANAKLKTKQHPLTRFADTRFNPNSGPQMQILLYTQMGLPVIDYTKTKQPATGAKTLKKLKNHTDNPEYIRIIDALIGLGEVTKILDTFIPAFEEGIRKADGRRYLHGNFNIGGTVSGRLSSSKPNLQNIPANSKYGSLIKQCFKAPKGWIMAGADFNALEDMISALTTKDPNKLKVYTDGYCGHCLRAFSYFPEDMPDIVDTVESINTIKTLYPSFRQDSKPGTFLLTYGGTYHGLMKNLGWDMEKAQTIDARYHELYKVSDEYVQTRLRQANKDGYVEVAFGFRVRTPLLKQVVWDSGNHIPYEAQAEGRTAGNALGQSYGLLNNRAAVAFFKKVWDSPYRHDILPIALIHDAIYILIRDDAAIVEWVNNELIMEMQWQDLPELHHDTVKLGAELDLFYPSWDEPITLPNGVDQKQIHAICEASLVA